METDGDYDEEEEEEETKEPTTEEEKLLRAGYVRFSKRIVLPDEVCWVTVVGRLGRLETERG